MASFGALRSLLQQSPGEALWQRVIMAVDELVEQERFEDELLPYMQAHLAAWPDELRTTPKRWLVLERDERDELYLKEHLGLALIRALTVGPYNRSPRGAAALDALLRSPQLAALTHLSLHHYNARESITSALINAQASVGLRWLRLGSNRLKDAELQAFLSAPGYTKLTSLDLRANAIGPSGAVALASCAKLATLELLNLDYNQVADEGAIALAQSPYLKRLGVLKLSDNKISDEGRRSLASSPHLADALKAQWSEG